MCASPRARVLKVGSTLVDAAQKLTKRSARGAGTRGPGGRVRRGRVGRPRAVERVMCRAHSTVRPGNPRARIPIGRCTTGQPGATQATGEGPGPLRRGWAPGARAPFASCDRHRSGHDCPFVAGRRGHSPRGRTAGGRSIKYTSTPVRATPCTAVHYPHDPPFLQ